MGDDDSSIEPRSDHKIGPGSDNERRQILLSETSTSSSPSTETEEGEEDHVMDSRVKSIFEDR